MKQQTGVGLVEILVALLVLAIGVLGYAGLQLSALKGSESAQTRAQASVTWAVISRKAPVAPPCRAPRTGLPISFSW